ncbi:MAG: FkbM family methyltransferase [Caldilineales bacterium]|nr:FkbM family methyltransferase [Caldilineales bacterium]
MKRQLIDQYKALFVRKRFFRFHRYLFFLSLWGMGLLNGENEYRSGEAHFIQSLQSITDPTKKLVVIDVGANVGNYSIRVKSVYPDAEVFAFEPASISFPALERNARQHHFQAFNHAMGAETGRAQLYNRPGEGSGHATLYREAISEILQVTPVAEEISVIPIDEFAQEHQLTHIDLLKIDAEGSEWDVLRGAQKLLNANAIHAIQFEFNTMNVVSRVFFRDFLGLLKGYEMYRMLPDGLVRIEINTVFLSEVFAYQNIVAIRQNNASPPATQ